jgi:hypothetical protein
VECVLAILGSAPCEFQLRLPFVIDSIRPGGHNFAGMTGRIMRPLRLTLLTLLVCGLAGCSRSQKFGTAISAQDVAKAMPEFTAIP